MVWGTEFALTMPLSLPRPLHSWARLRTAPAKAADLGGDCCADLEERVAELEATTVRKGNKKVKVELYGRMNRVINFWNDGAEQNVYSLNNSYNTEPLRHPGQGQDQRRLVERLS